MATIVWSSNGQELFAHFKNLGNRDQFNAILVQFKRDIEDTEWVAEDRVWRAPVGNIPHLVRFADRQNICLIWAGRDVKPTQLSLFTLEN
jgi:hypothetical protein